MHTLHFTDKYQMYCYFRIILYHTQISHSTKLFSYLFCKSGASLDLQLTGDIKIGKTFENLRQVIHFSQTIQSKFSNFWKPEVSCSFFTLSSQNLQLLKTWAKLFIFHRLSSQNLQLWKTGASCSFFKLSSQNLQLLKTWAELFIVHRPSRP